MSPSASPTWQPLAITQFSETMVRRTTAPDWMVVPGMMTLSSTTAPSSTCTPANSTLSFTVPSLSHPSVIMEVVTTAPAAM